MKVVLMGYHSKKVLWEGGRKTGKERQVIKCILSNCHCGQR